MEEQKVKEHGELFEAVDTALTMSLPLVFIENPLVAEKTEVRKAEILFLRCLKTVIYVLPVVRLERIFLQALFAPMAVVHLGVVMGIVMTLIRFQAGTEFYLSLLFAQLHHSLHDLNADRSSSVVNFKHPVRKKSSCWHHETAAREYLAMVSWRVSGFVRLGLLPLSGLFLHQIGLPPA